MDRPKTELEIYNVIRNITYKEGWTLILEKIERGYLIQWKWTAPCNETGVAVENGGRKWYISPYATNSEVVQTCLLAVISAEEHEAREIFKYKDQTAFMPHFDVEDLVELAKTGRMDVRQ